MVQRLGDRGRAVVSGLTRGIDAVHDATLMTVLHLRRLADLATSTVGRANTEIRELVFDVRDVAVTGLRAEPEDVALPPHTAHVRLPRAGSSPAPER